MREAHAVDQIGHESREETEATLIRKGLQRQRQATGKRDAYRHTDQRDDGRDTSLPECRGSFGNERPRRSGDADEQDGELAETQERQIQTRMREHLAKEAQVAEDQRLAQRCIFGVADDREHADQHECDAHRK
ncbi:hypothetical protein [Paraburkholderia antibiotica]|uniref:hypothetical protein n=1 Tax=Paraburkholderia antibiotica TaxID=2728839 RepID=UPI001E5E6E0A|nr:hypothetical protein [Paraburkholderia antibiotica]